MRGGGDTPEPQTLKFASSIGDANTQFVLGYYDNGSVLLYMDSNGNVILASAEGEYVGTLNPNSAGDIQTIEGSITHNIGEITEAFEYEEIPNLNIGDDIPNFEDYTKCLWA